MEPTTLDGQPMPISKIKEAISNVPKGKKIVEVKPGEYKTLSKLEG